MPPLSRLLAGAALVAGTALLATPYLKATQPLPASAPQDLSLPPGELDAQSRLDKSPRHGEFVSIPAGGSDSVRAYVVFPERKTKAPVVVVVHEIYGLSTWIRGVADQLAADGFIAVAPDFLSGTGVAGSDSVLRANGPAVIRALKREDVQRRIAAAATYGMNLPAAVKKYGVVGYCWGGGVVFTHAVDAPALQNGSALGGSVVYYGTSPATAELEKVKAPVLGLYGENDARVNATIAPADSAMKAMKKSYQQEIYPGAGHGFLRNQAAPGGANLEATKKGWPRTIAFLRQQLGS